MVGTPPRHISLDRERQNRLSQLVLTLVRKLTARAARKQAIRRLEGGDLTDEQVEDASG
jgi:hypothetical protein